jgi:O-antigen/teichoic acid export membrane protein
VLPGDPPGPIGPTGREEEPEPEGEAPSTPPARSLWARFLSGAVWILLGNVANRGLVILAGLVIARLRGRGEFGEFAIVQATLAVFLMLAGLGLGTAAAKFVAEFRTADPERAGRVMGLTISLSLVTGVLVGSLLFFLAPTLATELLSAPHLTPHLRVGALTVLAGVMSSVCGGSLGGLEAFRAASQSNLLAGLISFPVLVVGTVHFGILGAVGGLCCTYSLEAAFKFIALRRAVGRHRITLTYGRFWREASVLVRFGLPAMIHAAVPLPVNLLAYTLLIKHPLGGYAEMGIYNAALQWRNVALYVPVTLAGLVVVILSNTLKNREENQRVFLYSIGANVGVALVAGVAVAALAGPILSIYGEGFGEGEQVLVLAAMTTIPISAANLLVYSLLSQGRVWPLAGLNLVWGAVLLAFFQFVTSGDALGLAQANLVAFVVLLLLLCALAYWLRAGSPLEGASEPDQSLGV